MVSLGVAIRALGVGAAAAVTAKKTKEQSPSEGVAYLPSERGAWWASGGTEGAWCAWYANERHEVLPIEQGHRVVAVYNICVTPTTTTTIPLAGVAITAGPSSARGLTWLRGPRISRVTNGAVWVVADPHCSSTAVRRRWRRSSSGRAGGHTGRQLDGPLRRCERKGSGECERRRWHRRGRYWHRTSPDLPAMRPVRPLHRLQHRGGVQCRAVERRPLPVPMSGPAAPSWGRIFPLPTRPRVSQAVPAVSLPGLRPRSRRNSRRRHQTSSRRHQHRRASSR